MNKDKREYRICVVIILLTLYVLFGLTSCSSPDRTKGEEQESAEVEDNHPSNTILEPAAVTPTTMQEEVIEASVSLKDTTLQVSSEISEIVASFSLNMDEDMAELIEMLNQYNHTLKTASNESAAVHKENARVFFEMAEAGDSENTDLYYLAAIIQDPTNASYCWKYISYLDENVAPSSDYYALGSLVENTIFNNSYSDVENLIEVYNYIVENLFTTTVEDNSQEIEENRESSLVSLSADINKMWSDALCNYSYDKFQETAESITKRCFLLADYVDSSVSEKCEFLLTVKELLENLDASVTCIEELILMDDDEFEFAYPYVASVLDEAISTAVFVDASSYGVFSTLVDSVKSKVTTEVMYLNSRYDSIMLSELHATSKSILNKIKNNGSFRIANDFIYSTVKAEYEAFINDYSRTSTTLRGSDEAVSYVDEIGGNISEIYTAIYKYEYEKYQIWAATLMQTMKTDVEKAKNNQKLEALSKGGYYTINPDYLMPKLQTLYASLYEESYTKNSAKTDAELMSIYGVDIKGLGEV